MFVFCVCLLCGDVYFVFAAYLDQDSLVEEILYLNGTFLVKYVNQNSKNADGESSNVACAVYIA